MTLYGFEDNYTMRMGAEICKQELKGDVAVKKNYFFCFVGRFPTSIGYLGLTNVDRN